MSTKAEELAKRTDRIKETLLSNGTVNTLRVVKHCIESAAELRRLSSELAECKAAYESQFKELHALKASIGEPVAKIVYASDDCGTVEWIVHSGRPIRVGQNLYAIKDKP